MLTSICAVSLLYCFLHRQTIFYLISISKLCTGPFIYHSCPKEQYWARWVLLEGRVRFWRGVGGGCLFFWFDIIGCYNCQDKDMKKVQLPTYETAEEYFISPEGLQRILHLPKDEQYPTKNIIWTDDFKSELPIRMGKTGTSAIPPTTLIDEFHNSVQKFGTRSALSSKHNGVWHTINFKQYYDECFKFAKSLIAFKYTEFTAVNIIGFNAPEWAFAFFGSLFARCVPIGIYTTNNVQACEYIARHSEAKIVLAENREYAAKYYNLLEKGEIDLVIVYRDPSFKEERFGNKIISYAKFISEGERIDNKFVEQRMEKVRPGHCCTLVYTSGTTGMPKGVMLSHDNYVWTKKALNDFHKRDQTEILSIVSYLPLSHVASQFSDLVGSLLEGMHVHFAQPTALQGTLIQTLQEVRPKLFFSVPRVWQKIYDRMMEIAKSNGWLKTKIATWAKSIGPQGTIKEIRQEPTSFQFKIAKAIVYNNVKKAIGLDQCKFFFFGAAPLDPTIRAYFLSLNFYLVNSYGMSQSTGPQNFTDKTSLKYEGPPENYREVGRNLPGTQITIVKANEADQDGEICYRGRNVFMGYYKNPEETGKTIDKNGYLHSGDNGKITNDGILFITGRAKELIITAGGQNIPPILIENEIRAALPFLNSVMLVGDMRKYLTCLVALREDPPNSGEIEKASQDYLANRGCPIKKVSEGKNNEKLKKIILQGLKKANEKAISRAQHVQDFYLMPQEFLVENGLLTPTLKLKRKEVLKKYGAEIEAMYSKPSL